MKIDVEQFAGPCSCGKNHKIAVQEIMIEAGAIHKLEEMFLSGRLCSYQHPVIICDDNTYKATREPMKAIYQRCQFIKLSAKGLHANNQGVEILRASMTKPADLLLAVGSGTIHDLTRFMAHEKKIPFVSLPTAASVDGFVSTVAAMTWNGMKKTMPAIAPICVIADTSIFAKAPYRLTASGVSDLLGKYIALADWKIAHLVTGEYICERVCELEEEALKEMIHCLGGLQKQGEKAFETLMYALLLSGIAMQMVGNSRPASCAEHHVSHLWEMEVINDYVDALHGEKVSIGLMLCTKRYKEIAVAIRAGRCKVKAYEGMEQGLLQDTFGTKGLLESVLEENTPDPMECVNKEKLEAELPQIAAFIEEIPTVEELEQYLSQGDCIKATAEIGLEENIIPITMQLSPYVRNRLSFNRLSKMLEW